MSATLSTRADGTHRLTNDERDENEVLATGSFLVSEIVSGLVVKFFFLSIVPSDEADEG